jgi:cellulose synthase/poly-beta-1,6-N-acetylglucosamine synthase-like glycosyltransferase
MKFKLSFLIAAHNEEKLIASALNNLVKLHKDYSNIEILIGLDDCTDNTPQIVKQFQKKHKIIKVFHLNESKGKQAVLEKLEPHIKGDIVIIHDADWIFIYRSKNDLLKFLKLFNNPKLGGISDGFDYEMSHPNFSKINSLGFLASAWGNHYMLEYVKDNYSKKINKDIRIYDKNKMKFYPMIDIYRKKALDKTQHKKELRAGDHAERTLRIFNAGYDIITVNNSNLPRFTVSYNTLSIKDLINQRIRGIIAKKKIKSAYDFPIPLFGFKIPMLFYIIKNSFKVKRSKDFIAIYLYLFTLFYGIIIAQLKSSLSTKEVWNLRVKR